MGTAGVGSSVSRSEGVAAEQPITNENSRGDEAHRESLPDPEAALVSFADARRSPRRIDIDPVWKSDGDHEPHEFT
jgi:hypothetical protein